MSITDQVRGLFSLHRNRLNLLLHVVSLPILVIGLARGRPALIGGALLLEVAGHVYDYLRNFDRQQRLTAQRILPFQLVASVVVLVVLLKLFGWF